MFPANANSRLMPWSHSQVELPTTEGEPRKVMDKVLNQIKLELSPERRIPHRPKRIFRPLAHSEVEPLARASEGEIRPSRTDQLPLPARDLVAVPDTIRGKAASKTTRRIKNPDPDHGLFDFEGEQNEAYEAPHNNEPSTSARGKRLTCSFSYAWRRFHAPLAAVASRPGPP